MIKTVDARGMQCPLPVVEARKALKEMGEGELYVLVDNEIAVQNLLKLAKYLNARAFSETLADGQYRVRFTTGEQPAADTSAALRTVQNDSLSRGCVVVICADHMGEGDEELGRILMKGFIYALTNLDTLPETVLLYNGGAKLSTEGSECLEDLISLESQGVEIMTCGMCLNHFGLTDRLAVGSVTNMYVIAQKLLEAVRVVRP